MAPSTLVPITSPLDPADVLWRPVSPTVETRQNLAPKPVRPSTRARSTYSCVWYRESLHGCLRFMIQLSLNFIEVVSIELCGSCWSTQIQGPSIAFEDFLKSVQESSTGGIGLRGVVEEGCTRSVCNEWRRISKRSKRIMQTYILVSSAMQLPCPSLLPLFFPLADAVLC